MLRPQGCPLGPRLHVQSDLPHTWALASQRDLRLSLGHIGLLCKYPQGHPMEGPGVAVNMDRVWLLVLGTFHTGLPSSFLGLAGPGTPCRQAGVHLVTYSRTWPLF